MSRRVLRRIQAGPLLLTADETTDHEEIRQNGPVRFRMEFRGQELANMGTEAGKLFARFVTEVLEGRRALEEEPR